MREFEKLGVFYLGRECEADGEDAQPSELVYDSRDLCTHAVVVGMTGSGKTGLCIGMLEEAGLDQIPAIVIDPKGDIANLFLMFPELSAEEFRPWIDESQAARASLSPDQFAEREAEKWKAGLADWEQDGERIRDFLNKVELRVYTPGSESGRPLSILKSFSAPGPEIRNDPDALRDRITSATSGLLSLLSIDADPIRSREHILISNLLQTAWTGETPVDLNISKLITQVQKPPFDRVGAMELETFFPAADRLSLAMSLNNLLASPSFASWMKGEALDIRGLLHNKDAKPCISILSIAHLSDAERMFFVTILLNEMVAWTRSQTGTSSLRALLYMDEVFGYFPPVANPPSKRPMLTLLKQARAYGLGIVLATQNPVDLDYKGLSNTGTWFLGRLQTERDKQRVLEGLEGASAAAGSRLDRAELARTLAGLKSRRFLMNNVHNDQPILFDTRWVMSYLRGPLTRTEIQRLIEEKAAPPETQEETRPQRPVDLGDGEVESKLEEAITPQEQAPEPVAATEASQEAPQLIDPRDRIPVSIPQVFAEPSEGLAKGERIEYSPALLATGRLHYVRVSYRVDEWQERTFVAHASGSELPNEVWDKAEHLQRHLQLNESPIAGATFEELDEGFEKSRNYRSWKSEFKKYLYREQGVTIWKCGELKEYSKPDETLRDFKVRLEQKAAEARDEARDRLRNRFESRFASLKEKIRKAEDRVEREQAQYEKSRMNSFLNIGSTIMGSIFGGRSTRARTSARSYGEASKQKSDVKRAEANVEALNEQFSALEADFKEALAEIGEKMDVNRLDYEELSLPPRKSDISVEQFSLCWLPKRVTAEGSKESIY